MPRSLPVLAHYADEATDNQLMVVRIADGYSWLLPFVPELLELDKPLGVTCEHVYAIGGIGAQVRIARVSLATLGAGTPPD